MGSYKPDVDYPARIDWLIKRGNYRRVKVDGVDYVWPAHEMVPERADDTVRFLAPFDPVVWDRQRFEHLWGWAYRFEAYTPPAKRRYGYYALPLLWREHVIGWANTSVESGRLTVQLGFAGEVARKLLRGNRAAFNSSLESEMESYRRFLPGSSPPSP